MPYDRHPSTSAEEQAYASRLDLVTRRLEALIHRVEDYSTAVIALLDDAIRLHNHAKMRERNDVMKALQLLEQAVVALTAAEERTRVERETGEASRLREYAALFAIVSEWSGRFGPDVHTRTGQACVEHAKELIRLAIHTRYEGAIDRAVQHLHGAVTYFKKGDMVEETFGAKLEQLWQWYEVVARGVEPESEAHECLERFVVAVDVFNDAIARGGTDFIIETFDTAVALLKEAASARPRC